VPWRSNSKLTLIAAYLAICTKPALTGLEERERGQRRIHLHCGTNHRAAIADFESTRPAKSIHADPNSSKTARSRGHSRLIAKPLMTSAAAASFRGGSDSSCHGADGYAKCYAMLTNCSMLDGGI